MADYPPHAEIVSTLRELYTLLDTLAAIPANLVHLPPHPPNAINTAAALAAGYDADTVSLMCALPYLDVAQHEMFLQLLPSTFPITYLGEMDEGDFEARREMLHDEVMPPTALRLTRSEIYGTEFIYDTKTNLMTPWKPIDNPDEVDDYCHVPAAPPREVLSPVIERYRSLNYLGTPEGVNFNDDLFSESGGQPPKDWGPDDCRRWRAQYDVWAATRMLKDIYLECGWDVNAVEQTRFRRDEFLEKRARYWEDVVEPLIKIDEETK